MQGLIECLSAFIASIGFSFIFRIHHNFRFAIISSLGGALGWFVYLNTGALHNEIMSYFIAMVVVSLYAEMAARIYNYWLFPLSPWTRYLSNNALLYSR